ncbi:hypothetical protein GCM10009122_56880 [Fulvivirga kasyanovii]
MVDKEKNIRILLEIWQDAYICTTSFYHYTLSLIERFPGGGAIGDRNQVIARNELDVYY